VVYLQLFVRIVEQANSAIVGVVMKRILGRVLSTGLSHPTKKVRYWGSVSRQTIVVSVTLWLVTIVGSAA